MSVETWIALMGVVVPLINTSLLAWMVWTQNREAERHEDLDARFRGIEQSLKAKEEHNEDSSL